MLNYGVLFLIFLVCAYTKAMIKAYNTKKYYYIYSLSIVLIWASIEPSLLSISKNIFIVLL